MNLPDGYEYKDLIVTQKGDCVTHEMYCDHLKSKEDIENWVKSYATKAYIQWRVAKTFPNLKQKKCLFKIKYRCQHSSTRYRKKSSQRQLKSTNCPAELTITRVLQAGDIERTRIHLKDSHNHAMGTTDASLRYRDVSEQTREQIKDLFEKGHSPASAYHILQNDAMNEYSADYYKAAADRKFLPDQKYFYNIFYQEFRKEYGAMGGDDINDFSTLECLLKKWSETTGGKGSAQVFKNEVIVCLVTPLMQRVHSLVQQSGELMFLDASGHCDRANHQIYLLYTHSVAGGLPLGYIITNTGKQETFEKALAQFILLDSDNNFFFGQGSFTGPKVCITDNDLSERISLHKVWPQCSLLLCTVHVLRAVWRWLIATKNQIKKTDQLALFFQFKQVLYAHTTEETYQLFNDMRNSHLGIQYPQYLRYVNTTWWAIKESWCMSFREKMMLRGNHTNNYVEYAVRALKDVVLHRTKAYNIVQLVDFITTRLDVYYCARLTDFANNRLSLSTVEKFLPNAKEVAESRILDMGDGRFQIDNSDQDNYEVDTKLGICTCFVGMSGALCKHQSAVLQMNNEEWCTPNVFSKTVRRLILYVASGQETSSDWFSDLGKEEETLQQCGSRRESEINQNLVNEERNASVEEISEESPQNEGEEESIKELKKTFNDIIARISNFEGPEAKKAAENFCKNYQKFCRGDHSLLSAVSTFGKYSGFKKLASSSKIGVQPTSISRRKVPLKGRRCLASGRPCKSSIRDDLKHNYSVFRPLPVKRKHNIMEDIYRKRKR